MDTTDGHRTAPHERDTIWDRHAARQAEKAAFVEAVAATLSDNPVGTLAQDTSDYGEGGWHESHGDLDGTDLRLIALAAYYRVHQLPVPHYRALSSELEQLAGFPRPDAGADLEGLHLQLKGWAWTDETRADSDGYDPTWHRRSYGQCAVTALLVQQVAGGELVRVEVTDTVNVGWQRRTTTVSHYYNLLPDGHEVDLTRDQFERFEHGDNVTEPQLRDRAYLLGNADTRARYALLAESVHLPFVENLDT